MESCMDSPSAISFFLHRILKEITTSSVGLSARQICRVWKQIFLQVLVLLFDFSQPPQWTPKYVGATTNWHPESNTTEQQIALFLKNLTTVVLTLQTFHLFLSLRFSWIQILEGGHKFPQRLHLLVSGQVWNKTCTLQRVQSDLLMTGRTMLSQPFNVGIPRALLYRPTLVRVIQSLKK